MTFPPFILMYNACNIPLLQELESREGMRGEVVLYLLYLRNVKSCFYFH